MSVTRWSVLTVVALAATVAVPVRALGQATAPTTAPLTTLTPEQAVLRDLERLAIQLGGRSSTQPQRDEAARRLAARTSPEARDVLMHALRDGGHDPALAVARTLADDPRPDPAFIQPLLGALGSDPNLHEAAARALARFGGDEAVRTRLIAFARDTRQPVPARLAVIHALGSIVDRNVAQTLLDLLTDEARGGPSIQNAAGDALVEMTGLSENGRNAQRWRQWSTANAGLSDVAWKAVVYPGRATRLEAAEQRYNRLNAELETILGEQYQTAPTAKEKNAAIMRYLNAASADVRLVGARLVRDSFIGTGSYPPQAENRLKDLVGDSDARVRMEVARTLKTINFRGSLDEMLVQLAEEQDPDVKTALIGAVAQIGGLQSVPLLRRLLHDPSLRVATAAAESLKTLGKLMYAADPRLAHEIAQELWELVQRGGQEQGAGDLTAAAIEAIGPLRDPTLLLSLTKLLDRDQSERTRSAVLRALGDLGDPHAVETIIRWLPEEPSPAVRLDAIDALGKTATFGEAADNLYRYFGPRPEEQNAEVRQRAWVVFKSLLPGAPKQQLFDWSQRLISDPQRRIEVQLALNAKLLQDKDLEPLALSQQATGDTYMKLGRPDQAAVNFRAALDYWKAKGAESSVTEQLVGQLMDAHLQSKQFKQACTFASEEIAANRAQQETMGSKISNEADRLYTDGDRKGDTAELKDALALISEATKIKPSLDERYRDHLTATRKQVQERLGGE